MSDERTVRHEAAKALVEANAIDLAAVSKIIGEFAPRAIEVGDELGLAVGPKVFWACGWPGPLLDEHVLRSQLPG